MIEGKFLFPFALIEQRGLRGAVRAASLPAPGSLQEDDTA
jgi:hypothetical protein